jgi:phospholipase C
VILFMENHSFDSLLGFWCDNHPGRCPNGGMPKSVTLSDGTKVTPFDDPDTVPNVTIMDRIDAAGRTWKIYGSPKGAKGFGFWDICPTFAECLDTGQSKHLVPDSRFMNDAADGTLPNLSAVTPGGPHFLDGCHNNMSITACDTWIGQLVKAVENGPEWSSTAVFITFDDFGGFYDQVPPPLEPDGTQEGLRVPLVIVSPYAKPGYTDTTATTFAGILTYTEKNFGLPALGPTMRAHTASGRPLITRRYPLKRVRMITRPLPPSARHIHLTPALEHDPT